jgi:drug/metabolite transporter (DMT)-like permease
VDHHRLEFYDCSFIVAGMLPVGILFALLSAVLFGASTPLAKLLLGTVEPWLLAGLLYLGAGLGLYRASFTQRPWAPHH